MVNTFMPFLVGFVPALLIVLLFVLVDLRRSRGKKLR